jgi:hypothetical protein
MDRLFSGEPPRPSADNQNNDKAWQHFSFLKWNAEG